MAAHAIVNVIDGPSVVDYFKTAERKSRYLQSDKMIQEYSKMAKKYETHFAKKGSMEDWWTGGSVFQHLRAMMEL